LQAWVGTNSLCKGWESIFVTAAQLPKPGTGTPWHGFVLPKFGERYAAATRRKRRRQLVENKVEKLISRMTLILGLYATVLFVMGMADRLADLADPKNDSVGLRLEEENLPQRIRAR
jgi:hypothetical protein